MPRNRWLTPDSAPASKICRRVFIPNSVDWLAIVAGCLNELIYEYNFEQHGTATPAETAAIFAEMFDTFSLDGDCRMIGEIITYAGPNPPPEPGWLVCDGAHVSNVDYPALYDVIGLTYGGSGPTDFYLPQLGARSPIGGIPPALPVGNMGGEVFHTITIAELPPHTHVDAGHTHGEITATPSIGAAITGVPVPSAVPGIGTTSIGTASLSTVGGGEQFLMYHPYCTIMFYIKAE